MIDKYKSIEELCGIEASIFNDFCQKLLATGIRKTGEELWIIKKHKTTNKILREHYFPIYEFNPIQEFKLKFLIHHDEENIPKIVFLGVQSVWDIGAGTHIYKDKKGKKFVFVLNKKNFAGNYSVSKKYEGYEEYYLDAYYQKAKDKKGY